jgi:hypothetical protein
MTKQRPVQIDSWWLSFIAKRISLDPCKYDVSQEALANQQIAAVLQGLERVFEEHGVPCPFEITLPKKGKK